MDQIKLGIEVLSRIESELRAPPSEAAPPAPKRPAGLPYSAENPPALPDMVEEMGVLPPASMIIGACDDRSHLFLELTEPQPGAILILGEAGSGKSRLLQAMIGSLAAVNSPRHVRYALICDIEPDVQELIEKPHCYRHYWPNALKAGDLVLELADLIEKRQEYKQDWSAVVLAIDDLSSFVNYLDDETIEQLAWLIANGPEVRIWTIATLPVADLRKLDKDLIKAFGTRLVGKINEPEMAEEISGSANARPQTLQMGNQFGVVFGEEWIPFWVPTLAWKPAAPPART
jgi:energy-coupling factor transporter ATP-binding protein EcfA2